MGRVTGFGGVFFRSDDPAKTAEWFTETLGMKTESWGRTFRWRDREDPEKKGTTVLGLHSNASDYFGPSKLPFMLNFRVDDLEGLLADLTSKGVPVLKRFDPQPNGKFAHVAGPNGITIELWEPIQPDPYDP
jgi:lactoylglutathione lyase